MGKLIACGNRQDAHFRAGIDLHCLRPRYLVKHDLHQTGGLPRCQHAAEAGVADVGIHHKRALAGGGDQTGEIERHDRFTLVRQARDDADYPALAFLDNDISRQLHVAKRLGEA
ncbi:hypothetical protein D3C87_1496490 [compost metagenome]